jgi:peptidoglycan hydrolase-like protein with peptidoglycan-binding domain
LAAVNDDTDDENDAAPPARRRVSVSTLISLSLVSIAATAITWNALYNQRPKVPDTAARTIELKAGKPAAKPAAAQAAKSTKSNAKAGTAEIAVDAGSAAKAAGGASAQTVAALQAQLAVLGVYAGPANGALDAATADAVNSYRAQNGLDPDLPLEGVLDHARFSAEIVQAANFRAADDASVTSPAAAGDDAAAGAAAKEEVLFVQKGLAELGYAPGPADGHLGDITRRAIRDFQAERQLPVNGEITPELISELKKTSGLTTFLTRP